MLKLRFDWYIIVSQSFALTSISFKDLPLLYETIGGSLNILLSNACCWIKCQLCISVYFKLGTDGRYCMTKGNISCLHFCSKAVFLSSNVISARVVETRVSGYPLEIYDEIYFKMRDSIYKCCLRGVGAEKSECFAFNETLLDPCWVAT